MRKRSAQIIAVCGGSGSGKSTLARKFVGAAIVATDHFYKSLDKLDLNPDGSYDFDHPSAVDLEACAESCLKLCEGEDVWIPVYDMRSSRRMGTQLVPAPKNGIVIVEGMFIGALSWLAGVLLALPISKLLSDAVGLSFLRRTLNFEFSLMGVALWLIIVVTVAALASFFPAWRASRLTVREVLAYE